MAVPVLQDKRLWIGGAVVVALVLAAVSWLMLIHPKLASASDLRSQTRDNDFQNTLTEGKNARLARQSKDMSGLQDSLVKAVDALPPNSGLPSFTRELSAFAADASVDLVSVNVGAVSQVSATGTSSGAPSAAATPAPAASSSSSATTPSTTTPGTASSPAAVATGPYSIAITVQSSGPLVRQLGFLKALEEGPRGVQVTSTQLTTSPGSRVASVDAATQMTTQLTVFAAPMSPAQLTQLKTMLPAGTQLAD